MTEQALITADETTVELMKAELGIMIDIQREILLLLGVLRLSSAAFLLIVLLGYQRDWDETVKNSGSYPKR